MIGPGARGAIHRNPRSFPFGFAEEEPSLRRGNRRARRRGEIFAAAKRVQRCVPQTALLLIDLQNDFLVEGGAFSRRHVEASALIDAVRWSVDLARQRGHASVWIESVYGERAATPELKGLTHLGAPCCVRGSWGAEPVAPLRAIADATSSGEGGSLRLEKQFYCAFHETPLHAWLAANGVTQLVLAGLATNICVAATAKEARQLGYQVTVLSDATAAASLSRHLAALAELEAAGCRVRRWAELDGSGTATLRELGSGSALHLSSLPSVDGETLAALTAEVDWQTMSHRGGEVPRLVATQGDIDGDGDTRLEPLYRHPADDSPPVLPWTPSVARLRDEVAALVGHPLNHCLIQLYRDGRDWISAHSDKTLDVVDGSFIINVSVGALRTMTLRRKGGDQAPGLALRAYVPTAGTRVLAAAL